MADSKGHSSRRNSPSTSQPITRHPLFPAIVALWCAAAFGLGSLILPVSVVEHAVSATHLDSVVPKAAPPLGATARIIVTLGLTCLGGLIGLVLARRFMPMASPAPSRRRGQPTATTNEVLPESFFDEPAIEGEFTEAPFAPMPHADAPEDGRPAFAPPLDMPVQRRRRALALSDVDPLPAPARNEHTDDASVEPAALFPDDAALEQDAPSANDDRTQFVSVHDDHIVVNDDFQSEAHALTSFDAHHPEDLPAPITIGRDDAAAGLADHRVDTARTNPFQIFTAGASATPIESIEAPGAATHSFFSHQTLGEETDPLPTSLPDEPAEIPPYVPVDAPTTAEAPERRETNRLFDSFVGSTPLTNTMPEADAAPQPVAGFSLLPGADEDADRFVVPPFTLTHDELETGEPVHTAITDEQVAEEESLPNDPTGDIQPVGRAAIAPLVNEATTDFVGRVNGGGGSARIAGSDLDSLSPVELLERLAMAMDGQRKAEQARAAEAAAARATSMQAVTQGTAAQGTAATHAPVHPTSPSVVQIVTAFTPPSTTSAAPFAEPTPPEAEFHVSVQRTEPAPVAEFVRPGFVSFPSSSSAWHAEEEATQSPPPEWHSVEAAPVADHEDTQSPVFAGDAPMPVTRIPTALRPVALDPIVETGQDDEIAPLDAFPPLHSVPSRWADTTSLTGQGLAAEPTGAPFGQPQATYEPMQADASLHRYDTHVEHDANVEAEGNGPDDRHADDAVLEDGYSSLLNLSRPARVPRAFVRIEDSEADAAEPLPAVVFPGHEPHTTQPAFDAVPQGGQETGQTAGSPLGSGSLNRPFDAPRALGAGGSADPEETERALRAALATLQRMSGTA